jgi:hypothetical protein
VLDRGLVWGIRISLLALVAVAAWLLLASSPQHTGSGLGVAAASSLAAAGDLGDDATAATATAPPGVVVAAAFALVGVVAARSAGAAPRAALHARAPPSR